MQDCKGKTALRIPLPLNPYRARFVNEGADSYY